MTSAVNPSAKISWNELGFKPITEGPSSSQVVYLDELLQSETTEKLFDEVFFEMDDLEFQALAANVEYTESSHWFRISFTSRQQAIEDICKLLKNPRFNRSDLIVLLFLAVGEGYSRNEAIALLHSALRYFLNQSANEKYNPDHFPKFFVGEDGFESLDIFKEQEDCQLAAMEFEEDFLQIRFMRRSLGVFEQADIQTALIKFVSELSDNQLLYPIDRTERLLEFGLQIARENGKNKVLATLGVKQLLEMVNKAVSRASPSTASSTSELSDGRSSPDTEDDPKSPDELRCSSSLSDSDLELDPPDLELNPSTKV